MIYTQGCHHNCPGCHNPSTHDPSGGYKVDLEDLKDDILSTPLITGVTFSGGEPLRQTEEILELAKWVKQLNLTTTLYTGYELVKNGYMELYDKDGNYRGHMDKWQMYCFDYVVDGHFDISKKTLELPFRGSNNQRILKKGWDY